MPVTSVRRLALATVAACGVALIPATSASAAEVFNKINCTTLDAYANAKICLYQSSTDDNRLQGRFINNTNVGIENIGFFRPSNSTNDINCSQAVTAPGATSTCTKSVSAGRWYVGDLYKDRTGGLHYNFAGIATVR